MLSHFLYIRRKVTLGHFSGFGQGLNPQWDGDELKRISLP